MLLKKSRLIFIVFILFVFALLTYQSLNKEKDFISDLPVYPLNILERGISSFAGMIKDIFIPGKEKIFKKIDQGESRCLEIKNENERLRKLLELKPLNPGYVTTAEIFARDPTNWFQVLWISKGVNDGISRDMIAVTPSGVVGRIHRVFRDRASILQITDTNSSVAVRIQSSRVEGILEGTGNKKCYLKYVPYEVDVVTGDVVITSGLDALYPEGLLVGYIVNAVKKDGEFFQTIEVLPAQDFKTVEEVAILKR